MSRNAHSSSPYRRSGDDWEDEFGGWSGGGDGDLPDRRARNGTNRRGGASYGKPGRRRKGKEDRGGWGSYSGS